MEQLTTVRMNEQMIDECVDVYINTFSKEPWYDVYESREQVERFFYNHMANNYFLGYVAKLNEQIVAISIGMKKPWINGMEYYIDEFCVSYEHQGRGIGSRFLQEIEADITNEGLNGFFLNTEADFPSRRFYEKNGFRVFDGLVLLGK